MSNNLAGYLAFATLLILLGMIAMLILVQVWRLCVRRSRRESDEDAFSFERAESDLTLVPHKPPRVPEVYWRWINLTLREKEVVRLAAQGKTNEEIAETLVLSPGTIKTHMHNALYKLGIRSRYDLGQVVAQVVAYEREMRDIDTS